MVPRSLFPRSVFRTGLFTRRMILLLAMAGRSVVMRRLLLMRWGILVQVFGRGQVRTIQSDESGRDGAGIAPTQKRVGHRQVVFAAGRRQGRILHQPFLVELAYFLRRRGAAPDGGYAGPAQHFFSAAAA